MANAAAAHRGNLLSRNAGISLALTSAFMFCGIGFGSAVASWLYPLSGFYGVMISSMLFLLLALASLGISERLRARSAQWVNVELP
jgi:uncharacterized membrane protein YkvI